MEFDLFISYSRKDLELVKVIKSRIESSVPGIKIWFDMTGIESGEKFENKIIRAIDRSGSVLFVISQASMKSENTKREILYADNKGKKIIPVLIDMEKLEGWFLFRFGDVDFTVWQKPEQVERLLCTINKNTESARNARNKEEATKAKKIALKAQSDYIASQIQKLQAQQQVIDEEMSEITESEASEVEKTEQNPNNSSKSVGTSSKQNIPITQMLKKSNHKGILITAATVSVGFLIFILCIIFSDQSNSEPDPLTGYINGHEWVDLGLPSGLKWATCNIGASSPKDRGNYFAWGETTTKSEYTSSNCQTYERNKSWLRSNGYIDYSCNLTMSHDAARANWGGTWRMPTNNEIKELIENTTTFWISEGGKSGLLVMSKINGKSIFLPAAGRRSVCTRDYAGEYGFYWGSTLDERDSLRACGLYFYDYGNIGMSEYYRNDGESVRAVSE